MSVILPSRIVTNALIVYSLDPIDPSEGDNYSQLYSAGGFNEDNVDRSEPLPSNKDPLRLTVGYPFPDVSSKDIFGNFII